MKYNSVKKWIRFRTLKIISSLVNINLRQNDTSPKTMIMLNDMPYRKGKSVSPCFSKVFYAEATPGVVFLIILDHVSFGLEK